MSGSAFISAASHLLVGSQLLWSVYSLSSIYTRDTRAIPIRANTGSFSRGTFPRQTMLASITARLMDSSFEH